MFFYVIHMQGDFFLLFIRLNGAFITGQGDILEKWKNNISNFDEIKEYHKNNLYDNEDLHDIVDNTTGEEEINDYLYTKNYEYDDRNFDI